MLADDLQIHFAFPSNSPAHLLQREIEFTFSSHLRLAGRFCAISCSLEFELSFFEPPVGKKKLCFPRIRTFLFRIHASSPVTARDVPPNSNSSSSCQRTIACVTRSSSIRVHHVSVPAPTRDTLRVSLQFQFWFIMLRHQHLQNEIQFAFPPIPVPSMSSSHS